MYQHRPKTPVLYRDMMKRSLTTSLQTPYEDFGFQKILAWLLGNRGQSRLFSVCEVVSGQFGSEISPCVHRNGR